MFCENTINLGEFSIMKDFLISVLAGLVSAFLYERLPESKRFLNHLFGGAKKTGYALIVFLVATATVFVIIFGVKYAIRMSKYSASWDTRTDGILNFYTPSNDGFLYSFALYYRDQNDNVTPEKIATWIERIPQGTTQFDFRYAFDKPGKYYCEVFKSDNSKTNSTPRDENIRVCKSDEFAIETKSKLSPPEYVHFRDGVFEWEEALNAAVYIVSVSYVRTDENGNESLFEGVELKTDIPQLDTHAENFREFFYSNDQVIIRIKSVSAFPKEYLNSDFSKDFDFFLDDT